MSNRVSDAFNRLFESELANARSKEIAFIRADEKFAEKTGFNAYSNYDSFRTSRKNRNKKKNRD